jgi:L-rhamnose isomerase
MSVFSNQYINRYELTQKFLKSKKAKKLKLDISHKVMLLAVARESDRQNKDGIELTDDELLELTRDELVFQTKLYAEKLFILFGDNPDNEKIDTFIAYTLEKSKLYLEDLLEKLIDLNKKCEKMSDFEKNNLMIKLKNIPFEDIIFN